jgi:hypothetical protein
VAVSLYFQTQVGVSTFGILRPKVTSTVSSSWATKSLSADTASSGEDGRLVLARYASSIVFVKMLDKRACSPCLSASAS